MITRNRGLNYTGADIKRFRNEFIDVLFTDPHLNFTAKRNIETIRFLDRIVSEIETQVNSQIKVKKQFRLLLTTPGIGTILGLTIMLEVGDINRFFKAGRYSSYCRCVESKKISNGNRYLAWAYVEAANHAIRTCPKAQGFFQRKMSKRNRVLATKAVANKLTKATYYIMRDQLAFDAAKLFG
jgi:transposase